MSVSQKIMNKTMNKKKIKLTIWVAWVSLNLFCDSGCDVVYRFLQKEGAEERDLLGEVVPNVANPSVIEVQKLLKLYGYRPGNIDGQLGLNTRNAVKQFQKDNDLKQTRFVDQQTWAKLNIFAESGLVVKGEVDVKRVQMALKNARIDAGPSDGKWGRRTQEATKKFQKARGLKADGTIGYQTLNKLAQYLPAQQSTSSH